MTQQFFPIYVYQIILLVNLPFVYSCLYPILVPIIIVPPFSPHIYGCFHLCFPYGQHHPQLIYLVHLYLYFSPYLLMLFFPTFYYFYTTTNMFISCLLYLFMLLILYLLRYYNINIYHYVRLRSNYIISGTQFSLIALGTRQHL